MEFIPTDNNSTSSANHSNFKTVDSEYERIIAERDSEIAHLKEYNQQLFDANAENLKRGTQEVVSLINEIARLQAKNATLREIAEKSEWCMDYDRCPICNIGPVSGHAPDCPYTRLKGEKA